MRETLDRVRIVAEMQGRDLLRRRATLAVLVALPLVLYASLAGGGNGAHPRWYGTNAGALGVAWSIGGASLFATLAGRASDTRLVLAGYRPAELLVGRLTLLLGLGVALAGCFSALMVGVSRPPHAGLLVAATVLSATVAVPLGAVLATLLPRELEGTLALIGVVGVQLSLPESARLKVALPFYGPRELTRVSAGFAGHWPIAVAHALGYSVVLLVLSVGTWMRRVRVLRATSESLPATSRRRPSFPSGSPPRRERRGPA